MPRDVDPPRVQFVISDEPEPGPDLEPDAPRARRAPLALVLLAVVVVAIVLVVRARADSGPPDATGTTGTTGTTEQGVAAPPPINPSVAPLTSLDAAALSGARAQCPRLVPTCVTTGEIPTEVGTAIRAAIPGASVGAAVSDVAYRTTSGPSLAYRRLSARTDRLQVDVEIRAPIGTDRPAAGVYRRRGLPVTYELRTVGALTVRIAVTAETGSALPTSAVTVLATDPSLLAIG